MGILGSVRRRGMSEGFLGSYATAALKTVVGSAGAGKTDGAAIARSSSGNGCHPHNAKNSRQAARGLQKAEQQILGLGTDDQPESPGNSLELRGTFMPYWEFGNLS